jgi:hypothetical protein
VRFLLNRQQAPTWTRLSLIQHLRGPPRLAPQRIDAARAFAASHGVAVRAHDDGRTVRFFRSDADAPHPYPQSEAQRRRWRRATRDG